MNRSKKARLGILEDKRRAWESEHLPLSDLPKFLQAVLDVVQQEAGQATFQRVAGRIVGDKLRRVAALSEARR